ncbi:hypothetical protein FCL49_11095 [Serratia proteamaculans]|uniref:hypothetical protein n=1 Tax=Serratia TaxID=613 RepID=UPI0015757D0C|nr:MULTISPECIES: hypothetical protein [Serratia]NTX79444.1 hypothetical protein [Serratia proteamaculans]NTZ28646.1 hypothetical protein [Serratia proteamaculans]
MNNSIELSLRSALKKVTGAIERHERNEVVPLSIQLLSQVKKELEEMFRIMNPDIYMPGYSRFILDYHDDEGLAEELVNVAYQYGKINN